MAVKEVKGRPGEFLSTRTGHTYTSRRAAENYDGLEQMADSLARDRFAEEAMQKLSQEELLAVLQLAAHQSDSDLNRGTAEENIKTFLAKNPDYDDEGPNGARNAGALRGSLEARGVEWPYSPEQLQRTFEHLRDRDALILKPGAKPATHPEDKEEALYTMPLEELRKLANGF
jgi:hypothetical protein